MDLIYSKNSASFSDVYEHLKECDSQFSPNLSSRIDLSAFSEKIILNALMFEAWDNAKLVGLVSAYFNNTIEKVSFINNVSVCYLYSGNGVATRLLNDLCKYARENEFTEIQLEVSSDNKRAIKLYEKIGFRPVCDSDNFTKMRKKV